MAVTKLELTWVGKDEPMQKIEPRLLLHHKEKSYGEAGTGNLLIHGDNLLALRALLPKYGGRVKCFYGDVPFNTGEAFEYYDDNLEESLWLSLMSARLKLIYQLLSYDGTLYIHLDAVNLGYMLVLLDEIFGRRNRLYVITFKQGSATGHKGG